MKTTKVNNAEEKFRLEIEQLTNPDLIEETEEYYIFKKEDWKIFLEKLQEYVENKQEDAFEAGNEIDINTHDYKYGSFKHYKNDK